MKEKDKRRAEETKARAAGMARATYGRKTSFKNKKKEAARNACRGKMKHEE